MMFLALFMSIAEGNFSQDYHIVMKNEALVKCTLEI